jgi:hypothetical protein
MLNSSSTKELRVVLFSTDLLLVSSVSGAAASAGLPFSSVSTGPELIEKIAAYECVVCLDLNASHGDPMDLRHDIPDQVLQRAIAFGPHVHKERLEQAKQAGFGKVMSRGQFVASMRQEFLAASTK